MTMGGVVKCLSVDPDSSGAIWAADLGGGEGLPSD